jgi:hypothetical protein
VASPLHGESPQEIGQLAPLVLREITYRVLTGPQGLRLRQIASAGAPAQRIAGAIRWLKDHFAAPLRVKALAKHSASIRPTGPITATELVNGYLFGLTAGSTLLGPTQLRSYPTNF